MKKTISLLLALIILLGFAPLSGVAAEPAVPIKDGYTLIPTLYSKTGVDGSSQFVLTTPSETSLEDITTSLSIEGQPAPDITQSGDKEFIIAPVIALSPNSLYIFRLQRDGKSDITWAFQTAKKFQIT